MSLEKSTLDGAPIDFAEILCDTFSGPLDSCYVVDPGVRPILERLMEQYPIVTHSNYGEDFGFEPLAESTTVRRHIPLTHEVASPWYCNHFFYGNRASSYMFSNCLQFSKKEMQRVADRAAAVQDLVKLPLLHEIDFHYGPLPGSDIPEAEFIAGVVERAQTYLLLDLHNVYSNALFHKGYDAWKFIKTIPLDRVMEVHLSRGETADDFLHNSPVRPEVWEMLEYVIRNAPNLQAVTMEVQSSHNARSRGVVEGWPGNIKTDLVHAKQIWTSIRGGAE